jgi:hypothetical protein
MAAACGAGAVAAGQSEAGVVRSRGGRRIFQVVHKRAARCVLQVAVTGEWRRGCGRARELIPQRVGGSPARLIWRDDCMTALDASTVQPCRVGVRAPMLASHGAPDP